MNSPNLETEIDSWFRNIVKQIHCGLKMPCTHPKECTHKKEEKMVRRKRIGIQRCYQRCCGILKEGEFARLSKQRKSLEFLLLISLVI